MARNNKPQFTLEASTVVRRMRKFGSGAIDAASASLYRSGTKIVTLSKQAYVPVDTGALRSSLRTAKPKVTGSVISVTLSAGGPAVPYALRVHETNLAYRNGRQWKYLETPLNLMRPNAKKDLEDTLRAAFQRIR